MRLGFSRNSVVLSLLLTTLLPMGCKRGTVAPMPAATTSETATSFASRTPARSHATETVGVERLSVAVVGRRPHDGSAFTQGLLWFDGTLYESVGRYGESALRALDPSTGEVRREVSLAPDRFGEGLALVDDRLVQLTWRSREGYIYDLASFDRIGKFDYDTEGWGLCYDGARLIMSDGGDQLYHLRPDDYQVTHAVRVTLDGEPLPLLNELECVGDDVYANVWQTDSIVRIDRDSGVVEATIDASGLLSPDQQVGADVLNGIAYMPNSGTFLITGKLWPVMFEVRFVPSDDE